MEYTPSKASKDDPTKLTSIILSQNVRGFTKKDISNWLYSWKRGGSDYHAQIIFLQETHIVTTTERDEVATQWARLWGQPHKSQNLSYWSVHPYKQGGVAILIVPELVDQIKPYYDLDGRIV